MSSQIDLKLVPTLGAGCIAVAPWLVLTSFILAAAGSGRIWALACLPLAIAGGAIQFRRLGLLAGRNAVTGLSLDAGKLMAHLHGRAPTPVTPCASSRLGASLTLLKLRPTGTRFKTYHVILLAPTSGLGGNVCPVQFRRLRQWLRLGQSQSYT